MFHRVATPRVVVHITETDGDVKRLASRISLVNQQSHTGQPHTVCFLLSGFQQSPGNFSSRRAMP